MAEERRARLVVMISGGGRTLMNIADRIAAGELSAEVVLVIASSECPGAARARARGMEVRIVRGEIPAEKLRSMLDAARADWVVLGGYLKFVHIPPAYRGRVVNIHPALLPRFGGEGMYGHRVHRAVLEAGQTESGCTVHLCDDVYDHGPIILQERCPVLPGDTPQTLADRVFALECRAYPAALQQLIEGRVSVTGPTRS